MQRWPGRPASKLALTNQGTPALQPKPTVLDGFISNDVQLPNGLVTKLNEDIKNNIIANHGSIQQIDDIPQHIKDKYDC